MTKRNDYKNEKQLTRLEPVVDIYEAKDEFVLMADMPDVTGKGLDVTLDKDILTVTGKPGGDVSHEYKRSFTLTDRVDRAGIKASVKDGVLSMSFPFAEEAKARKIPITYN